MRQYVKRNSFTIFLAVFLSGLLLCIPSQIKVSLVSKTTVSPRAFPSVATIAALGCCLLSLVMDFFTMKKEGKEQGEEMVKDENISYLRIVACIALLLAWYLAMKPIGFIISTVSVMFVLSYMLGNRNKIALAVFPVAFTLIIYLVFSQLLHVNLPEILF